MSFADERKSIENRFKTEWTATPIAFDNVPFNPPSNADWVRLNIQNGDSGYRALEGAIRHTGIINVQIFTPVNKATKTSRIYADIVSDIFSDQRFDDIVTDVSSISIIDDDPVWLQTNVTTPYYRDAEKTFVPVPVFEPFFAISNDPLTINADDPVTIISGDVDVITPTRLDINGIIAWVMRTSNSFDRMGLALYINDVAQNTLPLRPFEKSYVHADCFAEEDAKYAHGYWPITHTPFNIVTDVLPIGSYHIKIAGRGITDNNGDTTVLQINHCYGSGSENYCGHSSSTLKIQNFERNIGGGSFVERDFSRLNSYLPVDSTFTTDPLIADTATKLLIPTLPKTIKDFTLDTPNKRWFFDRPSAIGKWFVVHLATSLTTSASNHVVTVEMYKNGAIEGGVGIDSYVTGGSDIGNLSLAGVTQLSHNDYIEVYATTSKNSTITFSRLAISINEMVGAI